MTTRVRKPPPLPWRGGPRPVPEDTTDCTRTGPCPCEAPCAWARQALDDIRPHGWPAEGLRLV